MIKVIEKIISISSSPEIIWKYLTDPNLMQQWMGDPEMNIEVLTDWIVGNPILIKGLHHTRFENKGTVLQFKPFEIIQYSHLSSISQLPDERENYSSLTFLLTPNKERTLLKLEIENFPTESIYKHLEFYWQGTIFILKNLIEQR